MVEVEGEGKHDIVAWPRQCADHRAERLITASRDEGVIGSDVGVVRRSHVSSEGGAKLGKARLGCILRRVGLFGRLGDALDEITDSHVREVFMDRVVHWLPAHCYLAGEWKESA